MWRQAENHCCEALSCPRASEQGWNPRTLHHIHVSSAPKVFLVPQKEPWPQRPTDLSLICICTNQLCDFEHFLSDLYTWELCLPSPWPQVWWSLWHYSVNHKATYIFRLLTGASRDSSVTAYMMFHISSQFLCSTSFPPSPTHLHTFKICYSLPRFILHPTSCLWSRITLIRAALTLGGDLCSKMYSVRAWPSGALWPELLEVKSHVLRPEHRCGGAY